VDERQLADSSNQPSALLLGQGASGEVYNGKVAAPREPAAVVEAVEAGKGRVDERESADSSNQPWG
jgi:hypothetical protein